MVRAGGQGRRVAAWVLGIALALPVVHVLQLTPARAAPPRRGAPAATRAKPPSKPLPKTKAPAKPANEPAAKPEAPVSAPASGAEPTSDVVRTDERGGEKTYTFGAQEVEGRLKSPQILYFLRRVRAQFDPAPLGHRSFLLELSDTRRHPAFE